SDGDLPPLESSSSTESLGTYRNVIAADDEARIYQRIQALQAREYYNIPPQSEVGEYETIVREHFDQARNVNHYLLIYDRESFELRVLEQKGLLQDRLFHLMLGQPNLGSILELSPYTEITKEAYEFLQDKVEPFSDPSFADQRDLMSANLNSFIE
ncbi:Epidermal growth factor receptor substrate 15-like 1, partial [Bienertia sinuspersici]